jgi:hypothetical protein
MRIDRFPLGHRLLALRPNNHQIPSSIVTIDVRVAPATSDGELSKFLLTIEHPAKRTAREEDDLSETERSSLSIVW